MPKTTEPGQAREARVSKRLFRDVAAIATPEAGTPEQREAKLVARRRVARGDYQRYPPVTASKSKYE